MKKESWTMPAWMEPYRALIGETGGNTVEDLMNRNPNEANVVINAPVALLCMAVMAQVALLGRLHRQGKLR